MSVFLSDSSFVLLSVFVGCLENDDLEHEVEVKSKLIIVYCAFHKHANSKV